MNALALRKTTPLSKPHHDQNVVQFATDNVAADVRVYHVDRRNRSNMYALRLASAEFDVTGRLVGQLPGGAVVELGALSVAAGSIGSARVTVTAPRTAQYESIFLEIRSDNVLLRVEAPRLPAKRGRALQTGAAVAGIGSIALCGGLVAFALPQRPVLAPPLHANAGSSVALAYASHGLGALSFEAHAQDGSRIGGGPIAAAHGEITFALPTSTARGRVNVTLALRGPLGIATTETAFAVEAPLAAPIAARPAPTPARVMSFSARRDRDASGESVLASYLAVADRGTIAVRDPSGTIVASAPFERVGTVRLPIAEGYKSVALMVSLNVKHGDSEAQSGVVVSPIAFAVAADPKSSPVAVLSAAPAPAPATGSADGLVGLAGPAVAGRTIALRVSSGLGALHAELQDTAGALIAQRDLAAGATRLAFSLPRANGERTYFLVLNYARNGGEETVVRKIVAAAP